MQQRKATTEVSMRRWLQSCTTAERSLVAQLWRSPAELQDDPAALADALLEPDAVAGMLARLGSEERRALDRVLAEGGSIPSAVLEREFGAVREHERYPSPRAYLAALEQPPSPTERLFLRGLLQLEVRGAWRSYVVPHDLRPLLPPVPPRERALRLPPAADPPVVIAANPWSLEHNLGTILAAAQAGELTMVEGRGIAKASLVRLAKRWGMSREDLRGLTYEQHWTYVHVLRLVLQAAGLLRVSADNQLRPTAAVAEWLQAPRVARLRRLLDGWVASEFDELRRLLGIEIKGFAIGRDMPATRRAILAMLAQAPAGAWVSWQTLLEEAQRADPDFLRTEGRYDTWRLVDYRGQSLDGYSRWPDVEGNLLRVTVGRVLNWLGLVDYGGAETDEQERSAPLAFRLTGLGAAALGVGAPPDEPAYEPLVVQATFEVVVPPHTTPYHRFQIGRVAAWVSGNNSDEAEIYRLTRASVQAAAAAGLDATAITALLEDAASAPLPPNIAYTLREWAGQHDQLTMRRVALLQADDPLLMAQLQRDRRLRLPPVEPLAEDTWALSEGDAMELAAALRKAGYGLRGDVEPAQSILRDRDLAVLAAALHFYDRACAQLGIDSEASGALMRRVDRLLSASQRNVSSRISHAALAALRNKMKIED